MHTQPFNSFGSLRNVLVFEKAHLCPLKYQIDQKYSVDIVNILNDYCSWKRQIFKGKPTEAHYQQPSLLCFNGTLC